MKFKMLVNCVLGVGALAAIGAAIWVVLSLHFDSVARQEEMLAERKCMESALNGSIQHIASVGSADLLCINASVYVLSSDGHMELMWNEDGRAVRCVELLEGVD